MEQWQQIELTAAGQTNLVDGANGYSELRTAQRRREAGDQGLAAPQVVVGKIRSSARLLRGGMTTRTYAWMSALGGFAAVAPSPHLFAMVDKIRLTFRKRAALVGDRAIHVYDPLFTHAAGQVFVATTV